MKYKYAFALFVLGSIVFSACIKESATLTQKNQIASTQASPLSTPTEQQMKLVETMRSRANEGTTITATREVLTITEMNNRDKMDAVYHLLNLADNDSFVTPLKNIGFDEMRFIRRFEGRTQINRYQISDKRMIGDALQYVD